MISDNSMFGPVNSVLDGLIEAVEAEKAHQAEASLPANLGSEEKSSKPDSPKA